jgi:hypothetical protein
MTVSSTSSRVVYSGDGATTAWPFAFRIDAAADIVVVLTDADGIDHTLAYGSQYAVAGFGSEAGGTVTCPLSGAPNAAGTRLTIYRDVAATQPAALSNQGAMWPGVIEAALDRLTFIAQKLADGLSRSLSVAPTDLPALDALPNGTARANKVLAFDAAGQPNLIPQAAVAGDAGGTTVLAAGSTVARPLAERFGEVLNVRDFGAAGDGGSDDTAAINAALAIGGAVVFPPGTYLVGNLACTVSGSTLHFMPGAELVDRAGTTGALLSTTGDDIGILGLSATVTRSPALLYTVLMHGNRSIFQRGRLTGAIVNPNLPNSYPAPSRHLEIRGASPTQYADCLIDDVIVTGGQSGLRIEGGVRLTMRDVKALWCAWHGCVLGDGLPVSRTTVSNFLAVGCGLYGLTLGALTSGASVSPYPYRDVVLDGLMAVGCGWNAYLSGNDAAVGAGKYGFDITSSGVNSVVVRAHAFHCCEGGLEAKGAVPSITITPAGYHNVDIELDEFSSRNSGAGLIVVNNEAATLPSSYQSSIRAVANTTYVQAPAWTAAMPYQPFDIVASDGSQWLCLGKPGDGSGAGAGPTAPASGATVRLQTNAATSSGAVLHFASTAGIGDGMTIFAGPRLADGATVIGHDGTTVIASSNVAGAGIAANAWVICATVRNDGVLNWLCIGSDPGYPSDSRIGVKITSSANVILTLASLGNYWGLVPSMADSSDNTISNLSVGGVIKDAAYGVETDGTGTISGMTLHDMDIEARYPLYVGKAGCTESIRAVSSRLRANAASGAAQAISSRGGTLTLALENVRVSAATQAVYLSSAGTHTITADNVSFATDAGSGLPLQLDGTTTMKFGAGCAIDNGNPASYPGYRSLAGALTVQGRALRVDQTAAPSTGTRGNVGEVVEPSGPGSADRHVCTAADFATPTFTWKSVGLS